MGLFGTIGSTLITDVLKAIGFVGGLLGLLKQQGIPTGSLGTWVAAEIANEQAIQADYDSGQAVVLGSFVFTDQAGQSDCVVVGVKRDGPAYGTLFGTNPTPPPA